MSTDKTDSGWRKRQIALDVKAENARELGLDYEIHSCSPFCTRSMCVAEALQAEREACAKWYEDKGWLLDESDVAAAIRARGEIK
jgi:hypothetical protein